MTGWIEVYRRQLREERRRKERMEKIKNRVQAGLVVLAVIIFGSILVELAYRAICIERGLLP